MGSSRGSFWWGVQQGDELHDPPSQPSSHRACTRAPRPAFPSPHTNQLAATAHVLAVCGAPRATHHTLPCPAAAFLSVVVDSRGTPYVALSGDQGTPRGAAVYTFDFLAGAFQLLPGLPAGNATFTSLALDSGWL